MGTWEIDPAAFELCNEGARVKLNPLSMRVLVYLAERAGEVVPSEELLAAFWRGPISSTNAVHKAVAELRGALGDQRGHSRYIQTVTKKGYRLLAPVERLAATMSPAGGYRSGDAAGSMHRTLAILPFLTIGDDADQPDRGKSLASALTRQLGLFPGLTVLDSKRVATHAPIGESIQQIGAALAATHVLHGGVRLIEGAVRVDVTLYDAGTGQAIYTFAREQTADGIADMQEAIVADLLVELAIPLDRHRLDEMNRWETRNVKAYRLAEEAEYFRHRADLRALPFAASCFREAIRLAPDFVHAYAALAATLGDLAVNSQAAEEVCREYHGEVVALLEAASRLAPDYSGLEALRYAEIRLRGGDLWPRLEAHARAEIQAHGVSTSPSYAYLEYADQLLSGRLFREAARFVEIWESGAPGSPWAARRRYQIAMLTLSPRLALPLVDATARLFPNDPITIQNLSLANALAGEFTPAERYLQRLREIDPTGSYARCAFICLGVLRGDLAPGSQAFRLAAKPPRADAFSGGLAHLMVGDVEQGLALWRQVPLRLREMVCRSTVRAELFIPATVVRDPRYQAYLDEIGIGAGWTAFLREKLTELAPCTGISFEGA